MATNKQILGEFGEETVRKNFACPKCRRNKTLKRLPNNFKCADIICDFCGYLAQVKTKTVTEATIDAIPSRVLGAAWRPQKDRMDEGIYFPLYLVLVAGKNFRKFSVFHLPSEKQTADMFIPRKPLSPTAKRAGWQGFNYDGYKMEPLMDRLK